MPKRHRILLIEDDPSLQVAMRYMIEDLGHDLVIAGDAVDARSAIENGPYDLAVVDYLLHNVPSSRLIAYLRTRYPQTPVVCSTAACEEQIQLDTELLRPDAILYKPFAPDELRRTLDSLLVS